MLTETKTRTTLTNNHDFESDTTVHISVHFGVNVTYYFTKEREAITTEECFKKFCDMDIWELINKLQHLSNEYSEKSHSYSSKPIVMLNIDGLEDGQGICYMIQKHIDGRNITVMDDME